MALTFTRKPTQPTVIRYAVLDTGPRLFLVDTCAGGTWSVSFDDACWFDTPELAAGSLSDGEQEVDRDTCVLLELVVQDSDVVSERIVPWPPREPEPAAPLPVAKVRR